MLKLRESVSKSSTRNPLWFLEEKDDDLKVVTSEASNKKLGIESIDATAPNEKGLEMGIAAKVLLRTIIGSINVTIWNSKNGDGSIYLTTVSRKYEKDNKTRYFEEIQLNKAVKAQILRYIWANLTEVEVPVAENDENEE